MFSPRHACICLCKLLIGITMYQYGALLWGSIMCSDMIWHVLLPLLALPIPSAVLVALAFLVLSGVVALWVLLPILYSTVSYHTMYPIISYHTIYYTYRKYRKYGISDTYIVMHHIYHMHTSYTFRCILCILHILYVIVIVCHRMYSIYWVFVSLELLSHTYVICKCIIYLCI